MDQKLKSIDTERRKKAIEKLSALGGSGAAQTDNMALWIDGNTPDTWENLYSMIEDARRKFDLRIQEIQQDINSYSQKIRRKGRKYWYKWNNGSWCYVGPVGPKDPREGLYKDIEKEGKLRNHQIILMRSCVIKVLGDHLLIDIKRFLTHVNKRLPDNIILVKDVIECAQESGVRTPEK